LHCDSGPVAQNVPVAEAAARKTEKCASSDTQKSGCWAKQAEARVAICWIGWLMSLTTQK